MIVEDGNGADINLQLSFYYLFLTELFHLYNKYKYGALRLKQRYTRCWFRGIKNINIGMLPCS